MRRFDRWSPVNMAENERRGELAALLSRALCRLGQKTPKSARNSEPGPCCGPEKAAQATVSAGAALLANTTCKADSTLASEFSGPPSAGSYDRLAVTDELNLAAADNALALERVPSGEVSSKFGGNYVVASYDTLNGEFEAVGGGRGWGQVNKLIAFDEFDRRASAASAGEQRCRLVYSKSPLALLVGMRTGKKAGAAQT